MSGLSLEDIESDYEGTAFEGISFVMDTHSPVVNFISESTDKQPDDFVSILDALLQQESGDFQSSLFSSESVHVVDLLRYILDLIDFIKTSITTKIRSSELENDWEVYINEVESIGHSIEELLSDEVQSSFSNPVDFLDMKSTTVRQMINILSYQGNEPQEGDFFVYDTGDETYIYGQISEEVPHKNRILDGSHYRYDLLAFNSELSDHDLVKNSDESLIRPRHSESLEIFKTNPFFE